MSDPKTPQSQPQSQSQPQPLPTQRPDYRDSVQKHDQDGNVRIGGGQPSNRPLRTK
jgi:hypothetical protein